MFGRTVCAALAAFLLCASPAAAGWTPKRALPAANGDESALAVNSRGEVALAWARPSEETGVPVYHSDVYVSFVDAQGRAVTRHLWSSASEHTYRLAVALDEQGVATVGWLSQTRKQFHTPYRPGTLRAAYGGRGGGWSPSRTLAHAANEPLMVSSPDGTVLLAWESDGEFRSADHSPPNSRTAKRATVAFRAPGQGFGSAQALARPRLNPNAAEYPPVTPVFDAAGAAYLTTPCDPAVARALPGSRRFTDTSVLASGSATSVQVGVIGNGDGIASWIGGRCGRKRTDEETPGPVFASVLHAGVFGPPVALTPPDARAAQGTDPTPSVGGGGSVIWTEGLEFRSTVSAAGVATPAELVRSLRTLFATGPGGDLVFSDTLFAPSGTATDVVIRPADGGADALSPILAGGFVVAPVGRAFAMLSGMYGVHLHYSVWRP